jgi:hypothetical protein
MIPEKSSKKVIIKALENTKILGKGILKTNIHLKLKPTKETLKTNTIQNKMQRISK